MSEKKISKDAQRLLVRAAGYITRRGGWFRGWKNKSTYQDSDKFCALGALHRATIDEGLIGEDRHGELHNRNGKLTFFNEIPAYREAATAIAEEAGLESFDYIPSWNDNHLTRKRDVEEVFCKAIKKHVEEAEDADTEK